jgi:hypothetical protein
VENVSWPHIIVRQRFVSKRFYLFCAMLPFLLFFFCSIVGGINFEDKYNNCSNDCEQHFKMGRTNSFAHASRRNKYEKKKRSFNNSRKWLCGQIWRMHLVVVAAAFWPSGSNYGFQWKRNTFLSCVFAKFDTLIDVMSSFVVI